MRANYVVKTRVTVLVWCNSLHNWKEFKMSKDDVARS